MYTIILSGGGGVGSRPVRMKNFPPFVSYLPRKILEP
jgi:hypothetical protein